MKGALWEHLFWMKTDLKAMDAQQQHTLFAEHSKSDTNPWKVNQ